MPTKQYVNLDPNISDQLDGLDKKRAGKYVTFTAKLNKAIEGVPIMFEMTAGSKYVSASLDSGNFTDANGESKIKLILSACGGDEFTVKAYIAQSQGHR
jgi:hypothetical protein